MSQLLSVIEMLKNYTNIDGKSAILEMKKNNGQWRQMEWIGWYYEFLIDKMGLRNTVPYFSPTGQKVFLDYRMDSILTDLKTHTLNSQSSGIILNDKKALEDALAAEGKIDILLLNGNAIKDDDDRSFQQWHCNLMGTELNAQGRMRKKNFSLSSIVLLEINSSNKNNLSIMRQGRNSNGNARPPKFKISNKNIPLFVKQEYSMS